MGRRSRREATYLYELISISAAPLKSIEEDFAVDSSGFSTGQFMRWLDVKYGEKEDRRQWLKLHLNVRRQNQRRNLSASE